LERERQRAIAHGRGETIDKVRQLLRLRAVGPTGAWVYVNEFFGWRRAPGTRDQQGGESAHPGGRHRAGLGLVAVSAAQPPEPMVSGAVRPRRSTRPSGGDRGPRPEVVDRTMALPRAGRGAGGRPAEDGVTGLLVGGGGTTE